MKNKSKFLGLSSYTWCVIGAFIVAIFMMAFWIDVDQALDLLL